MKRSPVATWSRVSFALTAFLYVGSPLASAAEFHLEDGTKVAGAFVGETAEEMHILDRSGKLRVLQRSRVVYVDQTRSVDPKLQKKAKKASERFFAKRRAEALALVESYHETQEGSPRQAVLKQLREFTIEVQFYAFDRGLRNGPTVTKEMCLAELSAFSQNAATLPLVRCSLYEADKQLADRAHAASLGVSRDTTRQLYEYVVAADRPVNQQAALGRLGALADRKSVPFLVRYLHYVTSTIRAQHAQVRQIREIPVSLGNATDVTIELPEISLIEVATTVTIPVETYRVLRAATISTLETITGERFGGNVEAWAKWQAHQAKKSKPQKR